MNHSHCYHLFVCVRNSFGALKRLHAWTPVCWENVCVLCITVRWEVSLSGSLLEAYFHQNSCVGQEGMPGLITAAGILSGGGWSYKLVSFSWVIEVIWCVPLNTCSHLRAGPTCSAGPGYGELTWSAWDGSKAWYCFISISKYSNSVFRFYIVVEWGHVTINVLNVKDDCQDVCKPPIHRSLPRGAGAPHRRSRSQCCSSLPRSGLLLHWFSQIIQIHVWVNMPVCSLCSGEQLRLQSQPWLWSALTFPSPPPFFFFVHR